MSPPPAGAHRLVLVGGGHTHVQVMRALAERPEPGLHATLVTDRPLTPYSGMLPGHVAGFYSFAEMHIDLERLARVTGAALAMSPAMGLDRARKLLRLADGTALPYDTLSLNIGITPDLSGIAGAQAHGIAVKPISTFLDRLDVWLAHAARPDGPRRIVIVGGGAAGVEIALALKARLENLASGDRPFWIGLVAASGLVPTLNAGVRRRARAALARHHVSVIDGFRVAELNGEGVRAADGRFIAADSVLISTAARAPSWLAATDLPLAQDGSVRTETTLAAIGDAAVFAVGDCGIVESDPRPKAGVFAVRQAQPLTENLRRRARGEMLLAHDAQRAFLAILMTGDGGAIAGRGGYLAVEGRWVWRWKDWIDRRFMARFSGFGPR
jgi:pyridine nucleotide-disulfide oxidoreductase family protein